MTQLIAGAHNMLSRSFFPWPTELLSNTDPLHLGLTSALLLAGGGFRNATAPLLLVLRVSHPTLHPLLLFCRPSRNFSYSWPPKKDTQMPKKWCLCSFSVFLSHFSRWIISKTRMPVVQLWPLEIHYHLVTDVTFLVPGSSSLQQALVVCAHIFQMFHLWLWSRP